MEYFLETICNGTYEHLSQSTQSYSQSNISLKGFNFSINKIKNENVSIISGILFLKRLANVKQERLLEQLKIKKIEILF